MSGIRGVRNETTYYEEDGIISKSTLEELIKLRRKIKGFKKDPHDMIPLILDICKEMLIICELPGITVQHGPRFYVPSMNRVPREKIAIPRSDEAVYILFEEQYPFGAFENILCLFIQESCRLEGTWAPNISEQRARIHMRSYSVFLEDKRCERGIRITGSMAIAEVLRLVTTILGQYSRVSVCQETPFIAVECEHGVRCRYSELSEGCKDSKVIGILDKDFDVLDKEFYTKEFVPIERFAKFLPVVNQGTVSSLRPEELKIEYDVFLAHDWGFLNKTTGKFENHEKALRVYRKLKQNGIKVWMDEYNLQDSVAHQIMEGIQRSKCVVVLITDNYITRSRDSSTNVSKELEYAAKHRELITVVTEPKCLNQKEWKLSSISFHAGQNLYYNLCDVGNTTEFDRLRDKIRSVSVPES